MTYKGWENFRPETLREHVAVATGRRRHKYNAVRCLVMNGQVLEEQHVAALKAKGFTPEGEWFDSKREAERYLVLQLAEREGRIQHLTRQVDFPLEVTAPDGRIVRLGVYRADFVYTEEGQQILDDSKGFRTPLYRWKKRHLAAQTGLVIRET